MVDFLLGIYLAGLGVRGWLRGFVRELMDLVGLIVGAAVAFRLSAPLGAFVSDRFGVGPEAARIGAGIALFLLFGVSVSVAAHYLSKLMNLPGLSLINRVLGTGVAVAWGVLLVVILVSIVAVLPVPDAVDEAIAGSTVAQNLAGPDSLPRSVIEPLIGDEALSALALIERISGERRIVPDEGERVELGDVSPEAVKVVPGGVALVADRVNGDRLAAGVDSLAWSEALAAVAQRRALAMYRAGFVARRTPPQVLEATAGEGLRLQRAEEMVALAATERASHAAIVEAGESALVDPGFDRVGLAVVEGPVGVMVVEVYGR